MIFRAITDVCSRALGLGEHRASIESPFATVSDFFNSFSEASQSSAGVKVTPQNAMTLSGFWRGVNLIAGDVAKLPLVPYRRDEQDPDDSFVDTEHPAFKLVRREANRSEHISSFRFFQDIVGHALVWGNGWALIERDFEGNPTNLIPLMPDRTSYVTDRDGRRWVETEIVENGRERIVKVDPFLVYHLRGISFDCEEGLKLTSFARESIGRQLAKAKFKSKFFRNGGRIGGVLQLDPEDKKAASKRRNQITEDSFREKYESIDQSFKTIVLEGYAKFHAAQQTFSDSQMVESDDSDLVEIANYFGIPPHKLGAKSQSSYGSIAEENRAYYDSCLSHWLKRISDECDVKLRSVEEKNNDTVFFQHVVEALLWADAKTLSVIASQGIKNRWLTPNEVRKWFNLRKIEGGDELADLLNKNKQSGDGAVDNPDSQVDDDGSKEPNEDLARALALMLLEIRTRYVKRIAVQARKAAKNYVNFNDFLNRRIDDHKDAGTEMFAAALECCRAAGIEPTEDPEKIFVEVKTRLSKAHEVGEAAVEFVLREIA